MVGRIVFADAQLGVGVLWVATATSRVAPSSSSSAATTTATVAATASAAVPTSTAAASTTTTAAASKGIAESTVTSTEAGHF